MAPKNLLQQLTDTFTCLPGVGQKTAQRFVYYLLERDRPGGATLAELLAAAMEKIGNCERCRMFTEDALCAICSDPGRDRSLLCVVENPADLIALESNTDYRGLYFVLHGRLSPLDDVGPQEIGLDLLEDTLRKNAVGELILATGTTVEGDVTAHVIGELAARRHTPTTKIAQGVPVGGELEYVDASTLAQAFATRIPVGDGDGGDDGATRDGKNSSPLEEPS